MIESMITFGYICGVIGLVCCIAAYFTFPKLIKLVVENNEQKGE